ncbi:hypothetical protein N9R79_03665 [Vibrio sp.]|nr:hypothetical protein [Vibrio sp.]
MTFQSENFDRIRDALSTVAEFELMTIMGLYQDKACRCFTDRPEIYALSGMKDIIEDDWHNLVIVNKTPYICHDQTTLIEDLKDEEQFIAHNWGSAVNLPVQLNGKVVGTVNLLGKEGIYKDIDINKALEIVQELATDINDFVKTQEVLS